MKMVVLGGPLGQHGPHPRSEVSTSTMNWHEGSGKVKTGARVKRSLSLLKACSALGVQLKVQRVEVGWYKEAAVTLDELVVEIREPLEGLKLLLGLRAWPVPYHLDPGRMHL